MANQIHPGGVCQELSTSCHDFERRAGLGTQQETATHLIQIIQSVNCYGPDLPTKMPKFVLALEEELSGGFSKCIAKLV